MDQPELSACDRFLLNDRVKWTAAAIRNSGRLRCFPGDRGVVLAFSRDGRCIYVRKEGRLSMQSYKHELWERADGK